MPTTHKWPWIVIFLYVGTVVAFYAYKFHGFELSTTPADWGTAGDYFGGFLNPLFSLMALYFLIKAYVAQKEELTATREALQASEQHQKDSATAQARLVELETQRILASQNAFVVQVLSANIISVHEEIKFFSSEVERCTVAINSNRFVLDLCGTKLHTDTEINSYRTSCLKKNEKLLGELGKHRVELQKYLSSE
jgi:L-lactate permease